MLLLLALLAQAPAVAPLGPAVVAPVAAPIKRDPTPVIAFPGQYAAYDGRPTNFKTCHRAGDAAAQLACLHRLTADWPYLGRYAAANAALTTGRADPARVVFMGDSITDNWSKAGYGGFFPGKPYVNRGISGQTTAQMLSRFRPDVVALQPRVVVILAGTNDLSGNNGPANPGDIENDIAAMAELASAHHIGVVLASLLPTTDEKRGADGAPIVRSRDRPPTVLQAINRWIAGYARAGHFVYLDYFSALADEQGRLRAALTDDGLHPNPDGYALMAPLAEAAIRAAAR